MEKNSRRDAEIAQIEAEITERDHQIAERIVQITERKMQIAERRARIAELKKLDEKSEEIEDSDYSVSRKRKRGLTVEEIKPERRPRCDCAPDVGASVSCDVEMGLDELEDPKQGTKDLQIQMDKLNNDINYYNGILADLSIQYQTNGEGFAEIVKVLTNLTVEKEIKMKEFDQMLLNS